MSFFREVFSDSGQGSSSRVLYGWFSFWVVVWVSWILYHSGKLPENLLELAGFAASPYIVNQGKETIQSFKNGKGPVKDA